MVSKEERLREAPPIKVHLPYLLLLAVATIELPGIDEIVWQLGELLLAQERPLEKRQIRLPTNAFVHWPDLSLEQYASGIG